MMGELSFGAGAGIGGAAAATAARALPACAAPLGGELFEDSTISVQVVRAIVFAEEKRGGVPRAQLLQAAQLSPAQLEGSDARIARGQVYQVCELVLRAWGERTSGLRWAEALDARSLGLVTDMIAYASSLRAGIEALSQYQRLLADEPGFQILEYDDHVLIRCMSLPGASTAVQRFVAETIVLGFWKLLGSFGVDRSKVCVSLACPTPSSRADYARIFAGSERFDQPFTGIVFARAALDAPSPHKDDDVHSVLRSVAQRRMLRLMGSTPYFVRVRELLVRQGPSGSNMDKVARMLGLSARTLRRRLAAEGKTYEQVLNEASAIVAKQLLATSLLSIQEASYRLGFSSPSAFHRAFKRWTGMTPLEFRTAQVARNRSAAGAEGYGPAAQT